MVDGKKLRARWGDARGRQKIDNSYSYEIYVSRLGSPSSEGRAVGNSHKKNKSDGGDGLFYFKPKTSFSGIDFVSGPFKRMDDLLASVLLHEDEILSIHPFR